MFQVVARGEGNSSQHSSQGGGGIIWKQSAGSLKYQFLQVIFLFSWIYVRYYQDHLESEVSTTITAIIALTVTLITSAMVPLDIFLVSYMKNSDGTFKVMLSGIVVVRYMRCLS